MAVRTHWDRVAFAGTVPPRVDQDELVCGLEGVHISQLVPAFYAIGTPMLEHERRPLAFQLVMDTDALVIDLWHDHSLPIEDSLQNAHFSNTTVEDRA
jgi:hypothetical protein